MDDSRERIWHWWLFIVLVLAGSIYGRTLEVHHRNRVRDVAIADGAEYERALEQHVATLARCLDSDRCAASSTPLFVPQETGPDVEYWEHFVLAVNHRFSPEFDEYYKATFHWNAVVRSAVADDGTVTDHAALASLLSGPIPGEIEDTLATARADVLDVKRTGRLYARVFGWGWKVLLSMLIVVPIATAPARRRRRRALTIASGFARATPTAANTPIPFGPADHDGD